MKYEEIEIAFKEQMIELDRLQASYNEKIYKLISDFNCFDEKYKNEERFTKEEKDIVSNIALIDFNKVVEEINKGESNIQLFRKYLSSYFGGCLAIRNEIIKEKNIVLIYSFLFNLIHVMELCMKMLKIENVEGFDDIKPTHNILDCYEKKKMQLLKFGLEEKFYNELMERLRELKEFVIEDDIPMCFKYPVNKDFKSLIISLDLVRLKVEDVKELVERLNKLLLIIMLINVLSTKQNFNNLIESIDKQSAIIIEVSQSIDEDLKQRKSN